MKATVKMDRQYSIIPYTQHDGVPTFRDSEIGAWFARIEAENTLSRLFFDGTVISAKDLVKLAKSPGVYLFTVWGEKTVHGEKKENGENENGPTDVEMVGFFWLRDFIGNAAFLHHVIFKKFWGPEARLIGRFVLEYVFGVGPEKQTPMVGTLLGLTPYNNIPAMRFARDIGMKMAGKLPGVFYDVYNNCTEDGWMSYMTRETCEKTRDGSRFTVNGSRENKE